MARLTARVWGLFSRDCAEYPESRRPAAEALWQRLDDALGGALIARQLAEAAAEGPADTAGSALLRATVREARTLYLVLVDLRGLAVAAEMTPAAAPAPVAPAAAPFAPGLPLEYETLELT